MKKQNRNPAPAAENSPALCPSFHAVLMPEDGIIDKDPNGYEIAIDRIGAGECTPAEMLAQITITATIRPLDIIRMKGKWFLQFAFAPDDGGAASGPVFGVEIGAGLSFEDAARYLCAGGKE